MKACGEVNGTQLLALSLSLPGLTVQLSLRALSSPRPPAYHPDKLTPADRGGRWSGAAVERGGGLTMEGLEGEQQILTHHKTGTAGSDHCSVDSS